MLLLSIPFGIGRELIRWQQDVEPPKKTMPKSMGTKGPAAGPATKITRVPANANVSNLLWILHFYYFFCFTFSFVILV